MHTMNLLSTPPVGQPALLFVWEHLVNFVASLAVYPAGKRVLSVLALTGTALVVNSAAQDFGTAQNKRGAVVKTYHDRGEFDGVVLVAEGDAIKFLGAFGTAGPDEEAPAMTPQTVFPICSVTKQFTAVLILQLVDAGKLRLESTLGEALPEFRTDDAGRAVTVRQLLCHSSGLPSLEEALPEVDGVEGFYRLTDLDFTLPLSVLQKYLRGPMRFASGSRFDYNNADYWVLGTLIEKLSGKSYAALLDEHILKPLGMAHSGLCAPGLALPPGTALGKVKEPGNGTLRPAPVLRLENFWAAGAMYSTAEDLLRWDVALDTGKLLSPTMQAAMFTADPKLGFVALSSWVYRTAIPGAAEKVLLVERQGEIGAFHALSLRLPEKHGHILLLSNLDVADLNSTYMKKGLPYELMRSFFPEEAEQKAAVQ